MSGSFGARLVASRLSAGYQETIGLFRGAGDRPKLAAALVSLGDLQHALGRPGAAATAWRESLAIFDELRHPDAAQVTTKLSLTVRTPDGAQGHLSVSPCPICLAITTCPAAGALPNDIVATTRWSGRHGCHNDVVWASPPRTPQAHSLHKSHTRGHRAHCSGRYPETGEAITASGAGEVNDRRAMLLRLTAWPGDSFPGGLCWRGARPGGEAQDQVAPRRAALR